MKDLAIIGGGITGLSAAWYAQQAGLDYTVVEQAERWGGKVLTEQVTLPDGSTLTVEYGPDSFIRVKPWAEQLIREIGLEDRLLPTNVRNSKVYILRKGKLTALPDGVMMIVPTRIMPFALTPLFTPFEKLGMGFELIRPRKENDADESVADFIRRRLGNAALDRLAEPLMSGIYNADPETQSLMATFPRFLTIEQKHGSLIKGMLAAKKARPSSGKNEAKFMSLKGGIGEMIDGLVPKLTGDLRLGAGVRMLEQIDDGYRVGLTNGDTIEAAHILLALPAFVAGELVDGLSSKAPEMLCAIRYVDTGVLTLAFPREAVPHPLDGSGVVIPRSEQRPINAITWTSAKIAQRAPEHIALIRVFFGGSRRPDMLNHSDEDLIEIAREQLQDIMRIEAEPLMTVMARWQPSTPQYDVGHMERLDQIEAELPPGIFLAGAAYRGIGLPDCVKQGKQVVEQVTG